MHMALCFVSGEGVLWGGVMEQETRQEQQPTSGAIALKVWETPTLETCQAADGIQGGAGISGDGFLLMLS
jgi:hypothetical protein